MSLLLEAVVDCECLFYTGGVMLRKSGHAVISGFLGFTLMMCALSPSVITQVVPAQQIQPTRRPIQLQPLSLAHLYWHFLVYQNHLDTKAAERDSQGQDGRVLRDFLQKKSGLSDADYVPVRASSVRLTAKVKDLDAQAKVIRSSDSTSKTDQLKALNDQRETVINSEIAYLKQNLSPDKIKAFEAFLTQFFSPSKTVNPPPFATGKPVPAAVQK